MTETIKNGEVLEVLDGRAVILNGRHQAIVLDFASNGSCLSPKVLSIQEAEKLLTTLVYALKDHGDEVAERLIEEFFTESEEVG
jgi:hypothetical protein